MLVSKYSTMKTSLHLQADTNVVTSGRVMKFTKDRNDNGRVCYTLCHRVPQRQLFFAKMSVCFLRGADP